MGMSDSDEEFAPGSPGSAGSDRDFVVHQASAESNNVS